MTQYLKSGKEIVRRKRERERDINHLRRKTLLSKKRGCANE
jgi:hypothetical protein